MRRSCALPHSATRIAASLAVVAAASVAAAAPDSRSEEHVLGGLPAGVTVERGIQFSADGAHVAFVGSKEGKEVPVVDGKSFAPGWYVHAPQISADGRIAFRIAEAPKKKTHESWVLLDGKRMPDSDGVVLLEWSPEGRRLALARYPECKIADDKSREGDCFVMVDGKKGAKRSVISCIVWSPDASRVAEIAEEWTKKPLVVHSLFLDGKSVASGSMYDGPAFSPDGSRLAYATQLAPEKAAPAAKTKWIVISGDKRVGLDFDGAGSPVFSPDGKRLAFKAEKDGRVGISVDGAPPASTWLFVTSPVWSPDGTHVAYVASNDCTVPDGGRVTRWSEPLVRDGTRQLVLDGKAVGEPCTSIDALAFSPDGKRLACRMRSGEKARIVCGTQKSADFVFVGPPQFLPDGRIAFGTFDGREFAWKVLTAE